MPEHNAIVGSTTAALENALRGRPRFVLPADQRVHVPETGLYTYPDIAVVRGKIERHPDNPETLMNPLVIVEVLSKSSESNDRGAKFAHYRRISSLKEYVLVSQDERRVEHFRRVAEGDWLLREYLGDATVSFPALGIEIPLAGIYQKLDLLREIEAGGAPERGGPLPD